MVAVAAAFGTLALATSLAAEPTVGKPAPAVSGTTVDGKKISLSSYKGKSAVLLNFYFNT